MERPLRNKKARDVMRREFLVVEVSTPIAEVVRLMDQNNRGGCVVQNAIKDTVGIFTERDLLRKVVSKGRDTVRTPVSDVMTANIVFAQADDDALELLHIMTEQNFRHLPVVDGRTLIGVISLKEFCRALVKEMASSTS